MFIFLSLIFIFPLFSDLMALDLMFIVVFVMIYLAEDLNGIQYNVSSYYVVFINILFGVSASYGSCSFYHTFIDLLKKDQMK